LARNYPDGDAGGGEHRRNEPTLRGMTPGVAVPPGVSRHTLLLYATRQRDEFALAAWIRAAVDRGDKVLVKHASSIAVLHRILPSSGLDAGVLGSGRVELVDAEAMGSRCGGRHERLYELHVELAEQAQQDGYAGLATTADGPALRALTRDSTELVEHERDIGRLVARRQVRALCRYHPDTDARLLPDVLQIHHHDVDDDIWTATISDDQLWIRGELDASNADRLAQVLKASVAEGVTVVNLSELDFCAVAGVRTFLEAADALYPGRELVLTGASPFLTKTFTITGCDNHPALRLVPRERAL
jgi:anti-anti-sigma factor